MDAVPVLALELTRHARECTAVIRLIRTVPAIVLFSTFSTVIYYLFIYYFMNINSAMMMIQSIDHIVIIEGFKLFRSLIQLLPA